MNELVCLSTLAVCVMYCILDEQQSILMIPVAGGTILKVVPDC